MTVLGEAGPAKVGIISMFDGVGSVYHIIKKKLGKPPAVYIAAEHDPVLRRLVSAELGLREDQHWGYNLRGSCNDIREGRVGPPPQRIANTETGQSNVPWD